MKKRALSAFVFLTALVLSGAVMGAPYAAMVIDARTGEVLHARNADTKLHPASLTKMMTLYLAFQAVESGKLKLDQKVKISRHAASEPPSRLGLRAGKRLSIRYLIRATAIKSANDAATALAEAIAGSEAKFAQQMNRQAKLMGMTRTTFRNAHGLTQSGHLSTARDMTVLGHRLMYDFPEYYHLFSRRTADAGLSTVRNTNRHLLANYRGADGIKTGYTRAAGYNLVSSAQRGKNRVIVTVFGGRSSATRNKQVAKLMNLGFSRLPRNYADFALPARPRKGVDVSAILPAGSKAVMLAPRRPVYRPTTLVEKHTIKSVQQQDIERQIMSATQYSAYNAQQVGYSDDKSAPKKFLVVERKKAHDRGNWVVVIGDYDTPFKAEKILLRTALSDLETFDAASHNIAQKTVNGRHVYRVEFVGLSAHAAKKACALLHARNEACKSVRPRS